MRCFLALALGVCLLVGCGTEPTPIVRNTSPPPVPTDSPVPTDTPVPPPAPGDWVRGPCPPGCFMAYLSKAILEGADLTGADLSAAIMPDGTVHE